MNFCTSTTCLKCPSATFSPSLVGIVYFERVCRKRYLMQFLTFTFSVEFYNLGQCGNKECPFLHIDPEAKIKDCAWYDRGYCRHGGN